MTVDLLGLQLKARSVGGIETCIEVPRFRLAFDIGRCPDSALKCETVLVTHAHIDHMAGLPWHAAMRQLRGMSPPTYVVPPAIVPGLEALFAAWAVLDNGRLDHELVPLPPGERLDLPRGLSVESFLSPHRAPTQGYALIERRRKLRAELVGLTSEQIQGRKRAGEVIHDEEDSVEVAFTGDAQIEVLDSSPLVRRARRLIIESTFLDDAVPPAEARRKGHIHLSQLAERASDLTNEAILLTHFSARYRAREIREALDRELPSELRARVQPLLTGHHD